MLTNLDPTKKRWLAVIAVNWNGTYSGAGITTAVVFHDAVDAFLRFEAGAGRTIWAPLTVRRHSIHAVKETKK